MMQVIDINNFTSVKEFQEAVKVLKEPVYLKLLDSTGLIIYPLTSKDIIVNI